MESIRCQDVEMQADESQPVATSTSRNQFNYNNVLVDPAKLYTLEEFRKFLQEKPEDLFFKDGKWTKTMTNVIKKVPLSPDRLDLLLNRVPGTHINIKNRKGNNLGNFAVKGNQLDNLRYLVERGLDCNAIGSKNRSLLHAAAYRGDEEMVIYLLDRGLKPNDLTIKNSTTLHYAVNNVNHNGLLIVQRLVENGANVLLKNLAGQTPLHTMAIYSNPEKSDVTIIKFLIEKGLSVNDRDNNGNTPLHHCTKDKKVKKCLIDMGADLNARNNDGKTPDYNYETVLLDETEG